MKADLERMSLMEKFAVVSAVDTLIADLHRQMFRRSDEPSDLWLPPEDVELLRRSK